MTTTNIRSGAAQIAAERRHQRDDHGYTPTHDTGHDSAELCRAAHAYLAAARWQVAGHAVDVDPPPGWPWDVDAWKPSTDPRHNLVKAGALIAAELDRLDRQAATATPTNAGQAEAWGWTVDRHTYPWIAYKGARFGPDKIVEIDTPAVVNGRTS